MHGMLEKLCIMEPGTTFTEELKNDSIISTFTLLLIPISHI